MKKTIYTFTTVLLSVLLLNSCTTSSSDDYLSKYEIQRLIEQAIRESNQNSLSEAEIRQIIDQAINEYNRNPFTEEEIKTIVEQIIRENNLNTLTEAEIRQLIEQAINDNNEKLEFTQWEIINFEVKESDWTWDDDFDQWQVFGELPELTEFIYEYGATLGYVFIGTQGVDEVQKILPYVETWYDGDDDFGNPIYFTETISFDIQYGNPSTVGFFIKSSDLFKDLDAPQNYNFRIVLIW